jgi:hypothetical protein
MQPIEVRYATLKDALGRKLEGWTVYEPGGGWHKPSESKEAAIKRAESVAALRCNRLPIKVVEK